ncbi:MAG TPA: DUF924 family protein [Candidatus Limnocylindria bacterium]|nr:DUF924 family protein [Candidatus Limnocylindria bacterium]
MTADEAMSLTAEDVLEFWFGERARGRWFASEPAFDDEIRSRFGAAVAAAARGDLAAWAATADGALALVILLDQFPRNIHRGTPKAFESDGRALQVATDAIERGLDQATPLDRRMFFYLPFEHSESLPAQQRSVELFSRWAAEHPEDRRADADDQIVYVLRDREIIERFGRFPHRNAVLGRTSTAAEVAFLAESFSSF